MKKKLLALSLALFLGGSAITSFAFDTRSEANAVINGETGLYTAYFGAPLSDVMDNFKGLSNWDSKVNAPMAIVMYTRKNAKSDEQETHVQSQDFRIYAEVDRDNFENLTYFPSGDWTIEGYSSTFQMNDRHAFVTMRDEFFNTFHEKYGDSYLVKKFAPTIYYTFWEMDDGRVASLYIYENDRASQYMVGVYYITPRIVRGLINTD